MREAGLKKRPPAEKVAARSVSIIAERDERRRLGEKSRYAISQSRWEISYPGRLFLPKKASLHALEHLFSVMVQIDRRSGHEFSAVDHRLLDVLVELEDLRQLHLLVLRVRHRHIGR